MLFKTPKPPKALTTGKGSGGALTAEEEEASYAETQITAFEDTWHWGQQAENEFRELLRHANTDVAELMRALRSFLKENDMMAYLTAMCVRLLELHRVLKPTGSLYLHCDPTASHYLKIVLDSVFRPENFLNEIAWKRTGAHGGSRRWGPIHDSLLFYAKTPAYQWNKVYETYDESYVADFYRFSDDKGRYRLVTLTGVPADERVTPGGLGAASIQRTPADTGLYQAACSSS